MRLFICTIRDSASASFHAPLFFPALGSAERWFRDEVNSSQSDLFKHPEDYELHVLGTYETEDGMITADESPRLIARGIDHVRKPS